jgi:hypothetical protein
VRVLFAQFMELILGTKLLAGLGEMCLGRVYLPIVLGRHRYVVYSKNQVEPPYGGNHSVESKVDRGSGGTVLEVAFIVDLQAASLESFVLLAVRNDRFTHSQLSHSLVNHLIEVLSRNLLLQLLIQQRIGVFEFLFKTELQELDASLPIALSNFRIGKRFPANLVVFDVELHDLVIQEDKLARSLTLVKHSDALRVRDLSTLVVCYVCFKSSLAQTLKAPQYFFAGPHHSIQYRFINAIFQARVEHRLQLSWVIRKECLKEILLALIADCITQYEQTDEANNNTQDQCTKASRGFLHSEVFLKAELEGCRNTKGGAVEGCRQNSMCLDQGLYCTNLRAIVKVA